MDYVASIALRQLEEKPHDSPQVGIGKMGACRLAVSETTSPPMRSLLGILGRVDDQWCSLIMMGWDQRVRCTER